jgi:hypothetical protein
LNAQSLRVIGQELVTLGVDAFNLAKRDNHYTVWIEDTKFKKSVTEDRRLAARIIRRFLRDDLPAASLVPEVMHFGSQQILWKDVERQLQRSGVQETADLNEMSLLMRALGDFLDRNGADNFNLFWSKNSARVVFGEREEKFNLLNLYNMGTRMYLKRSNRRSLRR